MPSADNELKSRNLRDILEQARLFLAGSESAHLDAELLLMAVLGKNRAFLRTWPDYPVERAQRDAYCELLERRKAGEPVAYLLGQWEFWSLPLQVNTHTLVPRPETELLVEQALARCLMVHSELLTLAPAVAPLPWLLPLKDPAGISGPATFLRRRWRWRERMHASLNCRMSRFVREIGVRLCLSKVLI